jgi:hypothetical protein
VSEICFLKSLPVFLYILQMMSITIKPVIRHKLWSEDVHTRDWMDTETKTGEGARGILRTVHHVFL